MLPDRKPNDNPCKTSAFAASSFSVAFAPQVCHVYVQYARLTARAARSSHSRARPASSPRIYCGLLARSTDAGPMHCVFSTHDLRNSVRSVLGRTVRIPAYMDIHKTIEIHMKCVCCAYGCVWKNVNAGLKGLRIRKAWQCFNPLRIFEDLKYKISINKWRTCDLPIF